MPGEHKIRTCDQCAVVIPDDDFRQQKAARYKGKILCAKCTSELKARLLAARKGAQAGAAAKAETPEAAKKPDAAEQAGKPAAAETVETVEAAEVVGNGEPVDISDIPISLDLDLVTEEPEEKGEVKVQAFGGGIQQQAEPEPEFKRPLLKGSPNATRCKTFHCKMSDASFRHLNNQINEWVDQHEDVEIKFVVSNVGVVEGKHADQHLIVTIFY